MTLALTFPVIHLADYAHADLYCSFAISAVGSYPVQALSEHDRETRLTALLEDEGTS